MESLKKLECHKHLFQGAPKESSCCTAGTVIMTHWCTLLAEVLGPLGGIPFRVVVGLISEVFRGHCEDGVL